MKHLIVVGGEFNLISEKRRASSIVSKLTSSFNDKKFTKNMINGGSLDDLPTSLRMNSLVIWMPNISNEEEKHYPKKQWVNTTLICSKVMREGYSDIDAVSRIFKMHGNAVIAIYGEKEKTFKLIDSLGTVWYHGGSISLLAEAIEVFDDFSRNQKRLRSIKLDNSEKYSTDEELMRISNLIEINKSLAESVKKQAGDRFFGNLSTRCALLFPSSREGIGFYVSPRNSDKTTLESNDMVYCEYVDDLLYYTGERKPSVDTPIQAEIYKRFPEINYMIHGHAFIEDAPKTQNYFLCGDLNAIEEISDLVEKSNGVINLKNHGFLFYSKSIEELSELIKNKKFSYER